MLNEKIVLERDRNSGMSTIISEINETGTWFSYDKDSEPFPIENYLVYNEEQYYKDLETNILAASN